MTFPIVPGLLFLALAVGIPGAPPQGAGSSGGMVQPAQFLPRDEEPRYDRRPDDRRYEERRYDERRYDERRDDRDRRYDERDRGREEQRFEPGRRQDPRAGQQQQQQQLLAQQVRDAQTRHNQGVVQLQQQFNQRQISRGQMDAGIAQLEVRMNAEIQQAQQAQRR